ncbi:hypothetical protein VPHD281_0094 [Vibrio phage D281]
MELFPIKRKQLYGGGVSSPNNSTQSSIAPVKL